MDDYNLSTITESKNEWCARLINILTPHIIEGFNTIFKEAYQLCIEKDLSVKGLMCIPPFDMPSENYFHEMRSLRDNLNKNLELSMGMSNDYKVSLKCGSNLIRIGSRIFS